MYQNTEGNINQKIPVKQWAFPLWMSVSPAQPACALCPALHAGHRLWAHLEVDAHEETKFPPQTLTSSLKMYLLSMPDAQYDLCQNASLSLLQGKLIPCLQRSSLIIQSRHHSCQHTTKCTPCTQLWCFPCPTHFSTQGCFVSITCFFIFL